MAKKTELEENIEAVETEEVETPKKSGWKVWTEEELAVLPRDEFQKVGEKNYLFNSFKPILKWHK